MIIGLTGSHRTGKTTLAQTYAQQHNIPFIKTNASGIFKELGLNPSNTYDFDTRLTVQEHILDCFTKQYSMYESGITDRTPLDLLAYTIADVGQSNVKDTKRFENYVDNCIKATNDYFSSVFLVQPGIKLVHEEGKATLNDAYISHLNYLLLGLVNVINTNTKVIPREITDLSERVDFLNIQITKYIALHNFCNLKE